MPISDAALHSPKRPRGRERRAGAVQAAACRESADGGGIETPPVRSCPKRLAAAVTDRAAMLSTLGVAGRARTRTAPWRLGGPRRGTARAQSKPKARSSIVANENAVSIACFRRRYELRPYRRTGPEKESERILLTAVHGLHNLDHAPAFGVQLGKPPSSRSDSGNN